MGHSERIPGFIPSFLVAFSVANLLCLTLGDPPYSLCSDTTNVTADSPFQSSLQTLMGSLPSYASASKLYNTSTGDDPNRVYVQYMCLNYVTNESCSTCIRTASQDILQLCGQQDTEAVAWEEQCQLRYSGKNFLGQLNVSGNIPLANKKDIAAADLEPFRRVVSQTVSNLTEKAAFDPSANMYAAGQVPFSDYTLHALAQCTTDLSPDDCSKCLKIAMANISSMYYSSRGARLLSRSCYLRYELYDFYEGATEPGKSQQTSKSNQNNIWKIIVVILASVLLTVGLVGFIVYFLLIKSGTPQETHGLGDQESAFMDLATIRVATGNFSDSNLLGEGGFGPVFKGVLSDGKEVAIKRLSNCSEQGSEEFTNEVLLIMKLQHKNLVRLLGFCVDGDERLLVYEFMSNNSLDAVLFDRRRRAQLNWSGRINIINGIAKGILYLHEGSRLRIIHRDLKASNVLLDNDMNPKISDFGMARIFAGSESEANTARIAGTYGYMAPEYAMEGLYSTRSDAFSFGVLVLEIITGRKNAGFHKTKRAPSLIAYAWQLWNEGKELELADPLLADSYSNEEFSNYVHVGLLCVQEDAHDRPAMSSVISMLNSQSGALPAPRRPAFSTSWFTSHNLANSNANNCWVNRLTVSDSLPR